MGRPPKGMDQDEHEALERFFDGEADEATARKARGVLRELCPEFAEQLEPRRGRPADPLLPARVRTRFEMLTDPRMRDRQMGRPYTASEAVSKIVEETGLSRPYVDELVRQARAELQRREQAREADRQAAREAQLATFEHTVQSEYRAVFSVQIQQWMMGNPTALEKELPVAHAATVNVLANKFGLEACEVGRLAASEYLRLADALMAEAVKRALERRIKDTEY